MQRVKKKHFFLKNLYQLREISFDKLDAFDIPCTDEHELFKTMAVCDFESVCVKDEEIKDTETTPWTGKLNSISVC